MLERATAAFFADAPFTLDTVVQADGRRSYRARVHRQVPEEWAGLVGDAIHNARSALDHLAWQLVLSAGVMPDRNVQFPIGETENGYGKALRSRLGGTSLATRDAVRELRPWRGGDDQLWWLSELDNHDKHRLLLPVAAAAPGIMVVFRASEEPDANSVAINIDAAAPSFPLRDGEEVYADLAEANSTIPMETAVRFEAWLGSEPPIRGPVGAVVRGLVEHARDVVEPLVATIGVSAAGQELESP